MWYFFAATFVFLMSWSTAATAEAKDLCKSGALLRYEQKGVTYFRIKDFDSVAFKASRSCEIDGLCEFTLMYDGPGKSEILWDEISVDNICHAFVVTKKDRKSPLFGTQSPLGLSSYPRMLFTSYRLQAPEVTISLEIRIYHDGGPPEI